MKLEQIRVNGFGILHDLTIDFEPDLTVIYGLNGSGKSTLLNFFRSVLYGFYQRGSPRRYEPLRGGSHGGSILVADNGQRYLLSRVSDRRSSGVLTIEDLNLGTSLPEGYLIKLTGGISQSLFETVYAFGLGELQQLKFLQDQDLSALLYSIGLGSNISLAEINDRLISAMDSIYKVRGSKPQLNLILAALKENAASLRAMGSVNTQYQELVSEIEAKQNELAWLRNTIDGAKQKLQQTKIMLEAWPLWQDLLIAREKLQKLPDLDLPENGLARLHALQTELKEIREKYHQAMARLPSGIVPSLDHETDLCQLKQESGQIAAELEQIKLQLGVASERHTQVQIECAEVEYQITATERQIEDLGLGKLSVDDLTVRRQWLAELKALCAIEKDTQSAFKTVAQLIGVCGWLVIGGLFYTARIGFGVWLTAAMLGLLLVWLGIDQIAKRMEAQKRQERMQELTGQLGIGNAAQDLALVECRLERGETLIKDLDQQRRSQQQLQARSAAYYQNLVEKQTQLGAACGKLQQMLQQYDLPTDLSIDEVRVYLEVLEGLPELLKRRENLERQLEDIYNQCQSSDLDQIASLYQIQQQRQETLQEITNLEVVLRTYLGSKESQLEDFFKDITKVALLQEQEQLEAEIDRLTTDFEELQKALGGLNVKRDMLEQNQKLEELQLEREILQTKARNMAMRWSSLKICHWVIEQVSRKYEQERQPEVLKLASCYFAAITEHRYRRIYAPIGMQEIKIEAANGEVLAPHQLSQGTVEQLYLAIRFALAVQIAQEKVEIPIFADDILVNFDRFRLQNTVKLIKELSARHQIILLTCHQRIADLFAPGQVRNLDQMVNRVG